MNDGEEYIPSVDDDSNRVAIKSSRSSLIHLDDLFTYRLELITKHAVLVGNKTASVFFVPAFDKTEKILMVIHSGMLVLQLQIFRGFLSTVTIFMYFLDYNINS